MTQGSQLKAMDSYFKSLLSEAVAEKKPQPEPVKEPVVAAQVPFAEPVVEQQTRLADLLAQVEPLSEAKVVVKTETQVKVARLALYTRQLDADRRSIGTALLDKHYLRKHGPGATYGQQPPAART